VATAPSADLRAAGHADDLVRALLKMVVQASEERNETIRNVWRPPTQLPPAGRHRLITPRPP